MLLFVNPALLIAALAGNGNLPRPALGAAYAGLSAAIAIKNIGMLSRTEPDLIFAALAALNAALLAAGTWCAWGIRKDPLAPSAQASCDKQTS